MPGEDDKFLKPTAQEEAEADEVQAEIDQEVGAKALPSFKDFFTRESDIAKPIPNLEDVFTMHEFAEALFRIAMIDGILVGKSQEEQMTITKEHAWGTYSQLNWLEEHGFVIKMGNSTYTVTPDGKAFLSRKH